MSDLKQVKVDNWGIYFLQRLKHFFNRTDYCDLTLQFQDNAQLKVHRLVLNACTEYFELLERTCEMYEDCLVMPDDLQADVVVPIVNFMYTGQLEFKMSQLEKLYQTSLVMNIPVLSKLLKAHRAMPSKSTHVSSAHNISGLHKYTKSLTSPKHKYLPPTPGSKRSFSKAFETSKTVSNKSIPHVSNKSLEYIKMKQQSNKLEGVKENKIQQKKDDDSNGHRTYRPPSPMPLDMELYSKKLVLGDPRPTRYELPEELDTDNIFENSFSSISYTSTPLMVHPETTKQYSAKKNVLSDASSSRKGFKTATTVDIVECKKITRNDNLFEDDAGQNIQDDDLFQSAYLSVQDNKSQKDPNQLFDQILDTNEGPKVTIEAKDKQSGNLDHAKIISEVLKKYPHLVKSNKNIKLKILNTPTKSKKACSVTPQPLKTEPEMIQPKNEISFTYETDVLDSKEAAKLIAMGAENIKGPWICLICGTPGKALNFTSYYNFRRHLVEVHNEKPISTICEYCGLKSLKRNYMLHHIYTRHGVPPPPQYHFPKCNVCGYIALTEGFLVKHKINHVDPKTMKCLACSASFSTATQLQVHLQKTGHYRVDKKTNLQCPYCMRVFLRETNYFAHIKINHAESAIRDGIIEDSDDEKQIDEKNSHEIMKTNIKHEQQTFDIEYEDADQTQYQIQQHVSDNEIHVNKKAKVMNVKHKILNPGFNTPSAKPAHKTIPQNVINNKYIQEIESVPSQNNEENVVVIDNNEYVMKDNQLIPRQNNTEYILSDLMEPENAADTLDNIHNITPTTSMEFAEIHPTDAVQSFKTKKSCSNQPIQIVVSNEEEYKALMASNHSIIFDDGDTNKTLTVLTAPHNTSLENTSIDMENTQPNDMMIIQEDYQMNVSQTVTADSKYVVVYSHAVGHNEPDKQYQIITPQEIGPQYVETSEVVTQNFETVTTSAAPILNAHVVEAQMEEVWPNNMQQNIENNSVLQVGSETEIATVSQVELPNEKIHEDSVIDLPDIQLTTTASEQLKDHINTSQQIENDESRPLPNSENSQCNNTEQVVIEEVQANTDEPMDIQITSEIEKECNNTEELETNDSQEMTHNNITIENPNVEEHPDLPLVNETNQNDDNSETNNDSGNLAANIEDGSNTEETSDAAETMSVKNDIVTKPHASCEQIKNITSEWSEDENDIIVETSVEEKNSEIQINPNISEEPEIEESIENIQQEMQNQLSNSVHDSTVIEENVISLDTEETDLASPKQPDEANPNVSTENTNIHATEKISSLLNDWEDNDSQEEMKNEENENEDGVEAPIEITPEGSKISDKDVISDDKENDKIKSLVSDWDDDEEENKD